MTPFFVDSGAVVRAGSLCTADQEHFHQSGEWFVAGAGGEEVGGLEEAFDAVFAGELWAVWGGETRTQKQVCFLCVSGVFLVCLWCVSGVFLVCFWCVSGVQRIVRRIFLVKSWYHRVSLRAQSLVLWVIRENVHCFLRPLKWRCANQTRVLGATYDFMSSYRVCNLKTAVFSCFFCHLFISFSLLQILRLCRRKWGGDGDSRRHMFRQHIWRHCA